MSGNALIWFRLDLRIGDNSALSAAVQHVRAVLSRESRPGKRDAAPLTALFVLAPRDWTRTLHWGLPKIDYIIRTAAVLQRDLSALGVPLIVRLVGLDGWKAQTALADGADFSPDVAERQEIHTAIAQAVVEAAQVSGAAVVFANGSYDAASLEREAAVRAALNAAEIAYCPSPHDECAVPPGTVRTKAGTPHRVFTPFLRAWSEQLLLATGSDGPALGASRLDVRPCGEPQETRDALTGLGLERIEIGASEAVEATAAPVVDALVAELRRHGDPLDLEALRALFPAGEAAAAGTLRTFLASAVDSYAEDRNVATEPADAPGETPGRSMLSAPMAVGAIGARQVVWAALEAARPSMSVESKGRPGLGKWVGEVAWRDFYRHVAFHNGHVREGRAFQLRLDDLPWRAWPVGVDRDSGDADFARWCAGQTGFPIVDAAMRQLNATGWIDNRLRMIVGSFLTKDLLIHWRLGERYFMRRLVDYDWPSNNGGWQWVSSVGTDAQPYFRIFSPLSQSEKYDPDGSFIRRWASELHGLPDAKVHAPTLQQAAAAKYPAPIVVHASARERALAFFRTHLSETRVKAEPGTETKKARAPAKGTRVQVKAEPGTEPEPVECKPGAKKARTMKKSAR